MKVLLLVTYFKSLGLALNFVGTLILIVGTMKTDKQIDAEAAPRLVKSFRLKRFNLRARSISVIGLILVSTGFFLQLIAIFLDLYLEPLF